MAAANTRRIQDIIQFNPAPENELNVLYGSTQPGEPGPVGRKRFGTAVIILDLVRDFQDLARRYEALEAQVAALEQGKTVNPSQPPRKTRSAPSGAFLKSGGETNPLSTDYGEGV